MQLFPFTLLTLLANISIIYARALSPTHKPRGVGSVWCLLQKFWGWNYKRVMQSELMPGQAGQTSSTRGTYCL
ncbi:hypothetical protein MGG_16625 [Pyricularia oryzae 70-15]|uniref:Secreted protein n=3 Tax=Pyricularia oryzae TaxID=318829 RepID=G4N0R6_PYRO7|nr:uncharacterized protein MGG_16625 [Pyricularia oryzae 70-15]EHA51499.1 hypothetical protein MGG_16625 [Pyricularia oryzae 70-15]ELQ36617.1 hypothetical protein OOU_Y34scaffold00650g6 [Pyricularia oryzae Y34]